MQAELIDRQPAGGTTIRILGLDEWTGSGADVPDERRAPESRFESMPAHGGDPHTH